jgi:hypothetical protein
MGTRGFVLLGGKEGSFRVYYRHTDAYPTGLGVELLRALKLGLARGAGELRRRIVEGLRLEDYGVYVESPEGAFPGVQGDVEWIYAVRLDDRDAGSTSVTIYRTSCPALDVDFVFPVFSSYVDFLPSPEDIPARMAEVERIAEIVLSALESYHKALTMAKRE